MFFLLAAKGKSWSAGSHTTIGKRAWDLLRADARESANFYERYSSHKTAFLFGIVDPDFLEFASGTHYYIYPGAGTVNVGQYYPMAPRHSKNYSARTRMEEHYQKALNEMKEGNVGKAFKQLGRAGHYLGDICCPAHSGGVQYPTNIFDTNYHKLFESYASKAMKKDDTNLHTETASDVYHKLDGDWGVELNEACRIAAEQKDNVVTKDESKYDAALLVSTPLSEKYLAALLDRFYYDTK